MKKFSALLCIALFITFGGVYAAWTYSTATATPVDETFTTNMTVTESGSPYGTLSVELVGVNISIDDKSSDHIVHKSDLDVAGTIKITFTPAANADADIKAQGIDIKWSLTSDATFGTPEADIFTITGGSEVSVSKSSFTKEGNTFVYEIALDNTLISINTNDAGIALPTKAVADVFAAAVADCFSFSVEDATAA